jgi:uncharacterized membrane protein
MAFGKLFGHLHPILIHFAIALPVVALVFEWIAVFRRRPAYGPTPRGLLIVAVAGAALSIVSGLILVDDEDVGLIDDEAVALIDRHKLFAIVGGCAALVAMVLGEIHRRKQGGATKALYVLVLHAAVAVIGYAAALGGESKWGADWLPW